MTKEFGLINIIKSIRTPSSLKKNICIYQNGNRYGNRAIKEMINIIKNQERVIEEMMLKTLNIKIKNEVGEVGEVYNM